ncbi:MAG: DNA polymerase/3'-5' exonuclease PolX, partial [Candidatus Liptonbacteria bacterium]|nr:DNA polymerase/3'-5' exonuclease PolX [Candidatus Liptonbacteria bacterium]
FKPQAYEKASEIIGGMRGSVADLYKKEGRAGLTSIEGVGEGIADVIEDLLKTGKSRHHAELKKKTPVDLTALLSVEGLGPKGIRRLYKELGIRTLKDLERAAKKGKIAALEGFGKKSEENIVRGIEFVNRSGGRLLLGDALPAVERIAEELRHVAGVEEALVAGSLRRRKETIGDGDILVISKHPEPVMERFTTLPDVVRVYARGGTKASVRIHMGMDIDLRIVPRESAGAALNYFTGSKEHNVALRTIAIKKGLKLNEYGLFSRSGKRVAGKTEKEIYDALGVAYMEPELRENAGEIEAALLRQPADQGEPGLPNLIGYGDLRGDLQTQTNWTDGGNSIEEMAEAAMKAGLEYIAITDHTKRLAMTNGLNERRVRLQTGEIRRVNESLKKEGKRFRVLTGTECDILKDGSLDLPDDVLAELDVVGVSVHSLFRLSQKEQTERIIAAMRNPHADILFHPTGRLINRRDAYDVDMDALIAVAKETGTVLEVDAFPDRLDLNAEHIRTCVQAGVKVAIDSDAHAAAHFGVLQYGIAQARRGWAEKKDVINAWPAEKMLGMLKKKS